MKKISRNHKIILASAMTVVIIGLGFVAYRHFHAQTPVEPPASPTAPINYQPPTQAEKDQAQAHKEELAQQNQQTGGNTSGSKQVTPVITNANQIDQQITLTAYVGGIYENGGTCTFTLTQGSSKITKTSSSSANASTTDCAPIFMQRSDFPSAGDWQVVVSYSSSTAKGDSQTKILTVH